MKQELSRYVYPFSDYSFKRLFGRNVSKRILIDFLNALIKPEQQIINIIYLNTERLGRTKFHRKSVFDIYCETEIGDKFIIEMQRSHKTYFMDRAIFYSTFPIQDQSQKGDWNFNIKKTYTICLLDDCFDEEHPEQVVHTFKLIDTETKSELEQLIIYNIELPKFKKKERELVSRLDIWLYVLNNLTKFEEIPDFLRDDEIFKEFFMDAEIANFHRKQYMAYIASMKEIWEANQWRETVKDKEKKIAEREDAISQKEEHISQKEEHISQKEEHISQKEEHISQKEEHISQKEEYILKKEAEIKQEQKKIAQDKKRAEKLLLHTVKNLLSKGVDIQTIHECTGLDINTIQSANQLP